jgi:hypothetical protein
VGCGGERARCGEGGWVLGGDRGCAARGGARCFEARRRLPRRCRALAAPAAATPHRSAHTGAMPHHFCTGWSITSVQHTLLPCPRTDAVAGCTCTPQMHAPHMQGAPLAACRCSRAQGAALCPGMRLVCTSSPRGSAPPRACSCSAQRSLSLDSMPALRDGLLRLRGAALMLLPPLCARRCAAISRPQRPRPCRGDARGRDEHRARPAFRPAARGPRARWRLFLCLALASRGTCVVVPA